MKCPSPGNYPCLPPKSCPALKERLASRGKSSRRWNAYGRPRQSTHYPAARHRGRVHSRLLTHLCMVRVSARGPSSQTAPHFSAHATETPVPEWALSTDVGAQLRQHRVGARHPVLTLTQDPPAGRLRHGFRAGGLPCFRACESDRQSGPAAPAADDAPGHACHRSSVPARRSCRRPGANSARAP